MERFDSGECSELDGVTHAASLYKYPDRRPAEVEAKRGAASEDEYIEWRESTDLRDPYRIPTTFLRGTKPYAGPALAEAPLVVFVNSKSGGLSGPRVALALSRAVSGQQVFDVSQHRPGQVLSTIYANLNKRIGKGDSAAAYIVRNLNVLCCGGDGTVAWVLKTIQDLKLEPQPHVAVCPLGTGNDLALSFGWGNMYKPKWFKGHRATYQSLARIAVAKRCDLDCWRVSIKVPSEKLLQKLPHSMEKLPSRPGDEGAEVSALFWNYLSFGIDAESAWGFSHLRETKPALASRRALNMFWYSWFSCTSGWFCPRNFALQDKLQVRAWARTEGGAMEELRISHGIGAVVLLNLQSYGGGRDLWGLYNDRPDTHTHKSFKPPVFNDGLFEVVGLRNGWHTALVMGKFSRHVHATRLAQTSELVLEAVSPGPKPTKTFMQVDGEPWPQAVPSAGEQPLRVHVKLHGKSRMLFNTEFPQGGPKTRHGVARGAKLSCVDEHEQAPERSFASAMLASHQRRRHMARTPSLATAGSVECSANTSGPYASRLEHGLGVVLETSFEGGTPHAGPYSPAGAHSREPSAGSAVAAALGGRAQGAHSREPSAGTAAAAATGGRALEIHSREPSAAAAATTVGGRPADA